MERERVLISREAEIVQLQNQIETLKEELHFTRAKQEGLESYSSDLQRRMAMTKKELDDQLANLQEKSQKELGLAFNEKKKDVERLRIVISEKESEIVNLKLKNQAMQKNQKESSVSVNTQQQLVLNEQMKELALNRRIISEFENNNRQCARKWNSLLEENFAKDEKVKGMQMQVERLVENLQSMMGEFNSKFNEMNFKVLKLIKQNAVNPSSVEAAEFLVDQMRLIQEERNRIILENEELHMANKELIQEIDGLNIELHHYQALFSPEVDKGHVFHQNKEALLAPLKQRIEELADMTEELRLRGKWNMCLISHVLLMLFSFVPTLAPLLLSFEIDPNFSFAFHSDFSSGFLPVSLYFS